MSDNISAPQYTIAEALGVCLAISQRCLAEVRALALIPGPPGERGPEGKSVRGERGEQGEQGPEGKPGKDAAQITIRGTYDAGARYGHLDAVATGGSTFVARYDNPGACPGDGWQLIASCGRPGRPGPQGERGQQGERGLTGRTAVILAWEIDAKNCRATPIMSDASEVPPLELRGMFEQFQMETT